MATFVIRLSAFVAYMGTLVLFFSITTPPIGESIPGFTMLVITVGALVTSVLVAALAMCVGEAIRALLEERRGARKAV